MKVPAIKPGNAVTRQYRNMRKLLGVSTIGSGTSAVAAGHAFTSKQPVEGALCSACLVYALKGIQDAFSAMKKLRPDYKAIVKRAKSIYNK